LLARRRFELLPLQNPWARARLGLSETDLSTEVRLVLPDSRILGGADAVIELSRNFWWGWPFWLAAGIPGVRSILRFGYRWIARRRNCIGGACAIEGTPVESPAGKESGVMPAVVPLIGFPLLALTFRPRLGPWIFMWLLAAALYAGCKWLVFRDAIRRGAAVDPSRALGFLLAWPGMDAAGFFDSRNIPAKPRTAEWLWAGFKTLLGAGLLWAGARMACPAGPMLAGWVGMTGVIFLLHFGVFHLLSIAWRQAGVCAEPLMQNPMGSRSLAEFWGRRWNTAFNELAFRFTFRPLRRLASPAVATVIVFLLSGLVHDLVISLPARGGFGLPTVYFLIQGLGLTTERAWFGPRVRARHVLAGRVLTIAVTAVPAFWLFHPPFIQNVILPMLRAIGAIPNPL
jgi:alginate O-acetyltransferase complex protein AlgI